ncbi:MAG: glycosyltransferase family 2 protein [Cyclobacteriaceae bacterium]
MLISVILPCFNAASTIRSSVQSILDQTLNDWELIVVDDASTDASVSIVESFVDDRINLIQLTQNIGYPTAMNEGIAKAKGKYIARMDADDVSASTRLEEQVKVLENSPRAAFCGVARYRITPGDKMYVDKKQSAAYCKTESWDDLLLGSRIFTDPSVVVEKERILNVGGYRTFQRSGMDVDLWFRLMERYGSCVTITKPLFGKRLEPNSIIFKPQTALINQVPRVLAIQRSKTGVDDYQRNGRIDMDRYVSEGLVVMKRDSDNLQLSLGAWVTCFFLGDFYGCSIYWKSILALEKNPTMVVMLLFKKIIKRLRHNPYRQIWSIQNV